MNPISISALPERAQSILGEAATEPRRFYQFRLGIFLVQVLLCALPAAALLATGRATLAGYYFWAMLGLLLGEKFLMGKRDEALCLILAVAPFVNLLRSFAFYNVIIALLGTGFIYYFLLFPSHVVRMLQRTALLFVLFVYVALYYALSLFNSGDYAVNLRMFELVFTVAYVLLLSRNPLLLGAALTGMIVSAWAVGISMLPHMGSSARLGVIALEGQTLGNPGQLGVPLAFGFLALMVDRGQWLNLQSRPLIRWTMLFITVPLLALTTSRVSWLVAAGGVIICTLVGRQQRMKMLLLAAVVALAVQAVLLSPFGESFRKGLDRTFSEKRSTAQRTSGRSDQWKVAVYVCTQSLETLIRGYGPGLSPKVYAAYAGDVPGVKYGVGKKVAFHSLFMQIAVDAGLIGLFLLLSWMAAAFFKIVPRVREMGVFPLVCFFSYLFIVVTVAGNDINSGILLGMALAGTTSRPS